MAMQSVGKRWRCPRLPPVIAIGILMASKMSLHRRTTIFAFVGIFAGWACSGSTAPGRGFTSLTILGPSALRTGETAQFRAMGLRSDGSQEEVAAQWSVTGAALTVESASGSALAAQPGTAELRASLSGISAVRALAVVPDVRGAWSGTTHFSCLKDNVTLLIGGGPSICGKSLSWDYTTVLDINSQQGDSVVGTLEIHGDNGLRGFVSGSVLVDGTLPLGTKFAVGAMTETGPSEYVFNDWQLRAQPSGISGSGELELKFTNAFGYQHFVLKVATMSLQR